MSIKFTIGELRRNVEVGDFKDAYFNLLLKRKRKLSEDKRRFLLHIAIMWLNYGDEYLNKLGYRIILASANLFKDYMPLYDVSINKGYIPISKFIEINYLKSEKADQRFFNNFLSAYKENFRIKSAYYSRGQKSLIDFSNQESGNYVLIAPTSYGKSDIIISKISQNLNRKVCVIVPSKALLAQTKRRLLNDESIISTAKRIITHPDMYNTSDTNFIAVLTQERLLRLLQKYPLLTLDTVLIDEAHNLFKADNRAILLTQVLLIMYKRNPSLVINYYTPFLVDSNNLSIPYAKKSLKEKRTQETLKIEKFFYCDLSADAKLHLYDQFTNSDRPVNDVTYDNDVDFLKRNMAAKNIVYINKPRDIEKLALSLSANDKQLDSLNLMINAISDFLHPDYNLIKCLKCGVAYHHGGMPDTIRLYVENIFSEIKDVTYIVTSSTLLEGVNIPAERIFLLSTKVGLANLSKSEFKNLIGRVCRFSEIFNSESGALEMLEPHIYVIKGEFASRNANIKMFLKEHARIDIGITDEVENVLLKEESKLNPKEAIILKEAIDYVENIEPQTVESANVEYVESEIGRLCYVNNVYDFDIKLNEDQLNYNFEHFNKSVKIEDITSLMSAIYDIFIDNVAVIEGSFKRLENVAARRFYSMILEWRTGGSSYKQMIGKFLAYWENLKGEDKVVYAGNRWGDIPLDEFHKRNLYVDLREYTNSQKVNLAIVRIKEEQDFVDNNVIKYVEILEDLELIEHKFYEKIKYGSNDPLIICLLKNGFSIDLAKCVMKKAYSKYVSIDLLNDEVIVSRDILTEMDRNDENRILIFEIKYHLN